MTGNRLLLKGFAVVLLAAAHLAMPAKAEARRSGCNVCIGACPSIWMFDVECARFCVGVSMGYCPGPNSYDICGPWGNLLICQGGRVE